MATSQVKFAGPLLGWAVDILVNDVLEWGSKIMKITLATKYEYLDMKRGDPGVVRLPLAIQAMSLD